MNQDFDVLTFLKNAAANPKSSFDYFIAEKAWLLDKMPRQRLTELYMQYSTAAHLCNLIPFSREEIAELAESKEISPYKQLAELEYKFRVAEYIFEKAEESLNSENSDNKEKNK